MNEHDLSRLLRSWPHEPGRINARQIVGEDGRPKIQVRLDLGVLQMEMDGRPDGTRPNGHETVAEHQRERMTRYTQQTGLPAGFVLSEDDCRALREEAVQNYHRYVALFAIADYARVIRDTNENLAIIDLCHEYAMTETDRAVLDQFRPQVIAMKTRAEAELAIAQGSPRDAIPAIDRGLAALEAIYGEAGDSGAFDHANEVQLLRGMRDALVPKLPASQRAELQERLQAAIDAENYELAAILRDELRMMT